MASVISTRATLDDLYRVEGKAELIGGRIVPYMASGDLPSRVAFRIAKRLDDHAEKTKQGVAYADGIDYAVPELPSGRESFSPDASFYTGRRPANRMRFIEGPPTFAAEVRSENDYTDSAEIEIAEKRADYFAAGTLVVWDVDPVAKCIRAYRAGDPANAITYRRGHIASAEAAVPDWQVAVDEIFGTY